LRIDRLTLYAVFALLLIGCATTDDLKRIRSEVNNQIQTNNDRISALETQYRHLKDEAERLDKEIKNTGNNLLQMRTGNAELRTEVTDLKTRLSQTSGQIDGVKEELRKKELSLDARVNKAEDAEKLLHEKITSLIFKVNFIENFLGIGKKDHQEKQASADSEPSQSLEPGMKNGAAGVSKSDKVSLYTAAFTLFKEGEYEKSREAFEDFLRQHPNTEFSDNAQFWLGECYYFEKQYERAIVEYDKVVKNFPGGNKVSNALLKQGLSFLKLGDKKTAKLLLQQVTKDYPNTSQAAIARGKLLEIK
jgi:tol-pal system protein YbgF